MSHHSFEPSGVLQRAGSPEIWREKGSVRSDRSDLRAKKIGSICSSRRVRHEREDKFGAKPLHRINLRGKQIQSEAYVGTTIGSECLVQEQQGRASIEESAPEPQRGLAIAEEVPRQTKPRLPHPLLTGDPRPLRKLQIRLWWVR